MASRRVLWVLNFLGFISYAVIVTAIGPSLPEISDDFNLMPDEAGALAGIYSLGGLAAILGGWVSDKVGRGLMVSLSLIIMGLGSLMMGLSPLVSLAGLSLLVIGVGAGFFEASSNAMVSDLYEERRGMAVNLLHIAWNVGSFIGPPLTAVIISLLGSWRPAYLLPMPLTLMLALTVFLASRGLPEPHSEARDGFTQGSFLAALPLASISIFIIAAEIGLSAWLPSLLVSLGATLVEGGLTIGVFWGLMGVGRLVWAPFTDRLGYRRSMMISASLGALSMLAASLPIPLYPKMILWASSGFFLAPLFPTLIAWITALNPRAGGAFSGMVFSMGTLGSFVATWTTGIIFSRVGVQAAQYVFPTLAILILVNTGLTRLVVK